MSSNTTPIIGGHVSAAGGVINTLENAKKIGAEAIQFFGSSPQMWYTKVPDRTEAEAFREAYAKSGIKAAYLHAAYLVNLASSNPDFYKKSIKSLLAHLTIAEMLGIDGLIFHIGSSKGMSREKALSQEIQGMREVLRESPGKALLVMENTAGGGEKVGANIEEMAHLFKGVDSPRVKICFDTAHAFEAGLITEYAPASIKKLFDAWDKYVGLEYIVAIHANDSKTAAGSHHDRHENIGEGHIGLQGFKNLSKEKRLWDKAWLLEVPGFTGEGPDKKNIDILKSCFTHDNE